jgi:tRNA threonylcarbamoyl adenosine modification protein YeaZ
MTKEAITLVLEGSTYEGSVALFRGVGLIAEKSLQADDDAAPPTGRGERLLPAVAECLEAEGIEARDIARIVCGAGPGRFTSLRIAGSAAKGLATGLGVELYAVSSLLLSVSSVRPPLSEGEYLSVLDAMRGECFVSRVGVASDGSIAEKEPARIVSSAQLETLGRENGESRIVGPGHAIDARPHARGVGPLLSQIIAAGPVDLASWEPYYGRLPEAQVRREAESLRSVAR